MSLTGSASRAVDWLLESDPSIRWQTLRDLRDASAEELTAERARILTEGWGDALLARLEPDGDQRQVAEEHRDWVVLETLLVLRAMGIDPAAPRVRGVVDRIRSEVTWQGLPVEDAEWHGNPFFDGEVEPCINGRALAVGAYFGQEVSRIANRLLTEQMADGGWNCEDDNGSTVGSFHSTINVLEGLLEFSRTEAGSSDAVATALERGHEYLLARGMFKRRSTGEIANESFRSFAFPPGYRYDVLRGLDYLRAAGIQADGRIADALDVLVGKRDPSGRWPLDVQYENHLDFEFEDGVGLPSRWNTLRALRVLRWAGVDA